MENVAEALNNLDGEETDDRFEAEDEFPALIHTLPFNCMHELCSVLDMGNLWKEIAGSMTGITEYDVEGCGKYGALPEGGSPSWYLLRIWASKGYSIVDLFNLFAITKMVRCMQIIKEHVDPAYHVLEEYVISSGADANGVVKHPVASMKYQQLSGSTPAPRKFETSHNSVTGTGARPTTNTSAGSSNTTVASDPLMLALQNTLSVPYNELVLATNNFSSENVLGKGGYGVVYRGTWKQLDVAVKRINASGDRGGDQLEKERLRQSLQELRTLAKYRHDNILPLYAFSLEGPEPCLVYKLMANGSLEDRLLCRKGSAPLSWLQKREIAEGCARGLLFLHTMSKTPIIHGDVKSANILLDKHLEPKLGDFGLSRDGQVEADADEKSPLIASHIKGTLAYLPPEFITSKILSTKLDVYSFGIVLLEIATGLRAYVDSRSPHSLVDFVLLAESTSKMTSSGSRCEHLMDKRTPATSRPDLDSNFFSEFLRMGLQCSHKDRNQRPSFGLIAERITKIKLL